MVTPRDLRKPPARERLHATVAEELEEQILTGELSVGDRLPSESAIAQSFGVSTRSVREAIQVLETKGLVRRRHGERTVVVRNDVSHFLGTLAINLHQLFASDPAYLRQLMDVRRMIEVEVAESLARREVPIGPEFSQALAELRAAADSGDHELFAERDAGFHAALVASAGNAVLTELYRHLFDLIISVIRVSSRVPTKSLERAYEEHARIHDRIASRDPAAAAQAVREHIDNSASYLEIALRQAQEKDD
ncbi:FadR/GntR family transcriptional regulator [Aliiruegeria lutimaris]|uniref:Transcriptional regulator, GntR family n=1 Tax=Aliiruegeria lutimaris TaxID=571298 RepID=A0A1G8YH41_9RHOB|nr:FadR/GntR family transcriptional regulator [Aliiruegeria lutimaris]SDK02013.1 transcriptional regulator, GntR family [Aliiruegeria lutimaris]